MQPHPKQGPNVKYLLYHDSLLSEQPAFRRILENCLSVQYLRQSRMYALYIRAFLSTDSSTAKMYN